MSEEKVKMPCELQGDAPLFLANRGLLLDTDGNYSLSQTPDSAGCNFNLNERGINPLGTGGPLMQQGLSTALENTFITASDKSSMRLWDDTFSILSTQDSVEGMSSAAVTPDSEVSSCRTSCRGSTDLSFSSGEMLLRSDSFTLEDQALPSELSSLEESSAITSHSESKLLLTPLGKGDCAGSHACFRRTFEVGDEVDLPSEVGGAMFDSALSSVYTTFLCENPALNATQDAYTEAEKLDELDAFEMPAQALFDTPMCAVQDGDDHHESEGDSSVVVSPDFVGVRSCQNTMNISCSSGEMVVRCNSFVLEEQPPSVVSLFEESPGPAATSHAEFSFLSSVCDREGAESDPFLGITFEIGENKGLPGEEDASLCKYLALPDEKASLRSTFICENAPADLANEAQFIHSSQAALLNETYAPDASVHAVTFDTPLCVVRDEDICTSTPLQNIGSIMPSLPTFALSPCTENTASPALQPVLRKRNAVTPKPFESGTSISGGKVTKMERSMFPKSDLSRMKGKSAAASNLDKPSQMNKHEGHKVESFRPSINTASSKAGHHFQRKQPLGTNKDQINLQKSTVSDEVQIRRKTLARRPAAVCSPASPDAGEGTSRQTNADLKARSANATFCYPQESPQKSDKTVPKPAPENDFTDHMKKVKAGSALGKSPKTPNSCPSASSTTVSRLKIAKPQKLSASFALPKSKAENPKSQCSSSRPGGAMAATETNCRKVTKIELAINPKTLTSSKPASCSTDINARVRGQPSSSKQLGRGSKAPAASPRTTPLNKTRPGTSGTEGSKTSAAAVTPLSKQKPTGNQKANGESSLAARTKAASSHHLQTTPRSSAMAPPLTPVPRRQQHKAVETSSSARTTPVSGIAGRQPTPFKVPAFKSRVTSAPAKPSAPVSTTPCKSAWSSKGQPSAASPSKRTSSTKPVRPTAAVDKCKPKPGARPQQQQEGQRGPSTPQQGPRGGQHVGPVGVTEAQVQHLQEQLTQSNSRSEALTVVLQQTLAQRDEAVRRSRGLSQELLELREELMNTVNRSEGLAQEKESLKASLQEALEQVRAQHQSDLLQLEQRLREQHQEEASAAQQQIREEAERSQARLQIQLEELRVSHETTKQDLETSLSQELQSVRQQHQLSLQELKDVHAQELLLNEKIQELTRENTALMERLADEENRNIDLSQKDSHTVYLERELESLKVVLDMKSEQLRQQEKKLMEVDKLTDKNVKLEDCMMKVQQENEDLKARMERHTALSRQLSSEQSQLQETLQKESKVNKRLSMENEELLWKLHNRPPSLFSSPPLSPR